MAQNPSQTIQGPGPNSGDGYPLDVSPAPGASFPFDGGYHSLANSTGTPLAAGGTFTGEWEETTEYTSISAFARSDQATAATGLRVEQSADGVTVDTADGFAFPAGNSITLNVLPRLKYFRVTLTNGAIAQGTLVIQTFVKTVQYPPFIAIQNGVLGIGQARQSIQRATINTTAASTIVIPATPNVFYRVITLILCSTVNQRVSLFSGAVPILEELTLGPRQALTLDLAPSGILCETTVNQNFIITALDLPLGRLSGVVNYMRR